jgi:hypothetical protein
MSRNSTTTRFRGLGSSGRRTLALVLAAAAVSALAAIFAPVADAWTRLGGEGRPGGVTIFQVQASHFDACQGNVKFPPAICARPEITGRGPVVRRSPALSGRQAVLAVYVLQRWEGGRWVGQNQRTFARAIEPGQQALQLPAIHMQPQSTAFRYRVVVLLAWGTPDYQTVGGSVIVLNHAGDYVCNTRFPCTRGAGWVWFGR